MADDVDFDLTSISKAVRRKIKSRLKPLVDSKLGNPLRDAAPVGTEGELEASIRVEDDPENELAVVVLAGGPHTTRISKSGWPYDYANAGEFGTSKQVARPWFWPTYQREKEALNEEIAKMVEEEL